jgi:hypothetical protein
VIAVWVQLLQQARIHGGILVEIVSIILVMPQLRTTSATLAAY